MKKPSLIERLLLQSVFQVVFLALTCREIYRYFFAPEKLSEGDLSLLHVSMEEEGENFLPCAIYYMGSGRVVYGRIPDNEGLHELLQQATREYNRRNNLDN